MLVFYLVHFVLGTPFVYSFFSGTSDSKHWRKTPEVITIEGDHRYKLFYSTVIHEEVKIRPVTDSTTHRDDEFSTFVNSFDTHRAQIQDDEVKRTYYFRFDGTTPGVGNFYEGEVCRYAVKFETLQITVQHNFSKEHVDVFFECSAQDGDYCCGIHCCYTSEIIEQHLGYLSVAMLGAVGTIFFGVICYSCCKCRRKRRKRRRTTSQARMGRKKKIPPMPGRSVNRRASDRTITSSHQDSPCIRFKGKKLTRSVSFQPMEGVHDSSMGLVSRPRIKTHVYIEMDRYHQQLHVPQVNLL